tara:strand:- start:26761 stop:27897 length:1137 start_codon:yes stop_codon:yes gene_type:complete
MGIVFKKNGRPTKKEKLLLKNINSHLSSSGDNIYENETVTNLERLDEIWSDLTSSKNNIKEEEAETVVKNENMNEGDEIINEANQGIESAQDTGIPSSFSPLSEPIMQRSYATSSQTDVGEIKEPIFESQSSPKEQLEQIEEEQQYEYEESAEESKEEDAFENVHNPQMEELNNKDKQLASKQLVQTVLDGYEMLHELGKSFVKYPEDKLQEKIIKQEIDPTMEIPLDEHGTTTNPVEFFQNFNEQAEEAISYDPEFGEKVRPAMERVFSKKGWGMTDEQYLMVAFGKDIAWKSVQIMNLKKTASGIMNTFEQLQKDKIAAIRQQTRQSQRTATVSPDSIVKPPSRVNEEPTINMDIDDVVDIEAESTEDSTNIVAIH